jgi:hypothetical protein
VLVPAGSRKGNSISSSNSSAYSTHTIRNEHFCGVQYALSDCMQCALGDWCCAAPVAGLAAMALPSCCGTPAPSTSILLLLSRSLATYRFSSRYDQPTRPAPVVTTNWWLLCVFVRRSPPAHLTKVRNNSQLAQQHAFPGQEPVSRRGRAGVRWCHRHTEGKELEPPGRVHGTRAC